MVTYSYAKINLTLDILKKRDDGYHEIKTVFQHINLSDKIEISIANDEIKVFSNVKEINNENNICYKAALFLKEKFKVKKGVNIFIEKNIPIAAGLSGGSSNAALVLKSLNNLWDLKLTTTELIEISKEIGMDVAFHLIGGTCLGEGRGEIITKLKDLSKHYVILIYPEIKLNTKDMYMSLDYNKIGKKNSTINFIKSYDLSFLHNDFEFSVFGLYPELKNIKNILGKNSLLSGSGSSIFKITKDKSEAEDIYNIVKDKFNYVFFCETKNDFEE